MTDTVLRKGQQFRPEREWVIDEFRVWSFNHQQPAERLISWRSWSQSCCCCCDATSGGGVKSDVSPDCVSGFCGGATQAATKKKGREQRTEAAAGKMIIPKVAKVAKKHAPETTDAAAAGSAATLKRAGAGRAGKGGRGREGKGERERGRGRGGRRREVLTCVVGCATSGVATSARKGCDCASASANGAAAAACEAAAHQSLWLGRSTEL
jgi:hypothetical protein